MKTIVIAGGSGFLGQILNRYFLKKGNRVIVLSRQPKDKNQVFWDSKTLDTWSNNLEKADVLINLTGKSVDCRYNEKNKKEILASRIDATQVLGLAINLCDDPPKLWINSSTATIYKHSLDKEMTEYNGDIGDDFSMNIAKSWEKTFYSITNPKTRKIAIRTSIVMGKHGGALIPLKRLVASGLGGKNGNGQQKVSWIHELDFARAIAYLMAHSELSGNFNLSVPIPTNNNSLMKAFRKAMHMPFGLPQPVWLIKLGSKLIRTEAELVLKSRNVIPQRLLDHGFLFRYNQIDNALTDLLRD